MAVIQAEKGQISCRGEDNKNAANARVVAYGGNSEASSAAIRQQRTLLRLLLRPITEASVGGFGRARRVHH